MMMVKTLKIITSIKLVILFLCSTNVVALSSLKKDNPPVQVSTVKDTSKVTELLPEFTTIEQLVEYQQSQYKYAPEVVVSVLDHFIEQHPMLDPKLLSTLHFAYAQTFLLLDANMSLSHINKIIPEHLNETQALDAQILKADVLLTMQKSFDAMQAYKKAYQVAASLNNETSGNYIALQLSQLYINLDEFENAQKWQQKVKQQKQDKNLALMLETASKLASQQLFIGDFNSSKSTLFAALIRVQKLKLKSVEVSFKLQLSEVYRAEQHYDKAQQELEQSFLIAKRSRNPSQQIAALIGLMKIGLAQNKTNYASKVLSQSEKLHRYLVDPELNIRYQMVKYQVLASTSRYLEALKVLEDIRTKLTDLSNLKFVRDVQLTLSDDKARYLALTGQSRSAIEQFEQVKALNQQYLLSDSEDKVLFLQQSYQYDQQRAKNQIKDREERVKTLNEKYQSLSDKLQLAFVIFSLLILTAFAIAWVIFKTSAKNKASHKYLDPVSTAFNHHYLSSKIQTYIQQHTPFSLVMFDIDKMLTINQQLGHVEADQLLPLWVKQLSSRLLKKQCISRLAGDRFIVVAKNFDRNQAFVLAEVLRKELNSHQYQINDQTVVATASFSVAQYRKGDTLESLKHALQEDLKKAKALGGNITCPL